MRCVLRDTEMTEVLDFFQRPQNGKLFPTTREGLLHNWFNSDIIGA
jgi:hypothetical protein